MLKLANDQIHLVRRMKGVADTIFARGDCKDEAVQQFLDEAMRRLEKMHAMIECAVTNVKPPPSRA